jgi:hypothetical protein
MTTLQALALAARDASVYIKIIAACVGLVAAFLWYKSAAGSGLDVSAYYNKWAAIMTAVSVGGQAISSLIDWWIAPTATWA